MVVCNVSSWFCGERGEHAGRVGGGGWVRFDLSSPVNETGCICQFQSLARGLALLPFWFVDAFG